MSSFARWEGCGHSNDGDLLDVWPDEEVWATRINDGQIACTFAQRIMAFAILACDLKRTRLMRSSVFDVPPWPLLWRIRNNLHGSHRLAGGQRS